MSRLSKLKQTTFAVPPEFLIALSELSVRTRIPQAAFVREALAALMKKYASMLTVPTLTALEGFAETASINAHNALAWKEERRVPEILPVPFGRCDPPGTKVCRTCNGSGGDGGQSPEGHWEFKCQTCEGHGTVPL